MEELIKESVSCEQIEAVIKENISAVEKKMQEIMPLFIANGYYLRRQYDEKMHEAAGFENFEEYVKETYGKSRSWALRMMKINQKFSVDGNSVEIDEKWLGYGKSQLQEMIYLTDEQLEEVTPGMTVKEIREIRKPEEEVPEEPVSKCKKPDAAEREYLNAFAKYFIRVKKEWFKQDFMNRVLQVDESPDEIKQMLGYNNRTWHFKMNDGAAHINMFDDYVQIWDENHEYLGDFEWFYLAAAIQSMWNVVAEEDAQIPEGVTTRRTCIFDKERDCSIEGAKEVAIDVLGIDCKGKCCQECSEDCGARCNKSSELRQGKEKCNKCFLNGNKDYGILECHPERGEHKCYIDDDEIPCDVAQDEQLPGQMEIHDHPGICPDETSIDELDLSVRTYNCLKRAGIDTIEQLRNMSDEELSKIRNFGKYNMDEVHNKLREYDDEVAAVEECATSHTEEIVIENDDTVIEADEIVVEEPENTSERKESALNGRYEEQTDLTDIEIAKEQLRNNQVYLNSFIKEFGDNDKRVRKYKILVAALASFVCDLEDIMNEEPEQEQPELPVLKNNDQRKEFIDNYAEWPIWLETKETGERYYRYNFDNGTAFVVKVYYHRCFDYMSKDFESRYSNRYGSEEYYLLMDGKFFKDCLTNKSALIEHLKEVQKK